MNIQAKIKQQGFTIAQVAARMKKKSGGIGISQGSLSTILNGNPTIDKLREVADIIGLSLSELVSDDDDTCSQNLTCPHCGKPIQVSLTVEQSREPVKRVAPRRGAGSGIKLVSDDGTLYVYKNPRTEEEKFSSFELQGIHEDDGMYNVRNINTGEVLDIEPSRLKKLL